MEDFYRDIIRKEFTETNETKLDQVLDALKTKYGY